MRFVFVVPFRNCRGFLLPAAKSLLSQTHGDWVAFFRDDSSDDGGPGEIPSDPRIIIQRNESRVGGLANLHGGIVGNGLLPSDVVCVMDGDDYLTRPDALSLLSEVYLSSGCLLSYGQYETEGTPAGHCRPYSRSEFGGLRGGGFLASHLKTFRYSLYEEAMRQDPDCERYRDSSGAFFGMAWDVALMTPLLEVAGFDRVAFNPHVVYHYRQHPLNEHHINVSEQRRCAAAAMSKRPMAQM